MLYSLAASLETNRRREGRRSSCPAEDFPALPRFEKLSLLEGDKLHVSATDLDVSVSGEHACEVLKEGSLAVGAKHLHDIVRSLP